jgi:ribosomal protein S18 acetylase RimI-like enzyme
MQTNKFDKSELRFREEVKPEDIIRVKQIVESTGFFYDYEVPVAVELVEDRLNKGFNSGYFFLFAEYKDVIIAYSCFGPIACTHNSYDLFWIVTHNDYRGFGIGKILLDRTEELIKQMGGRLLVVETSSKPHYLPTRIFYEKCNYDKAAQIASFYDADDDKVIYTKKL